MTSEEMIADLKQFITATVSQEVAGLRTELKADIAEVRNDVKALDQKLGTIQDAIADTLTHTTETTDATLQDHEQRLRTLEHRAA
jgi:uncharacterized protein involved in exopolysaccharide biosynthesis